MPTTKHVDVEDSALFLFVEHVDFIRDGADDSCDGIRSFPLGKKLVSRSRQKDEHVVSNVEAAFTGVAVIPLFLLLLSCCHVVADEVVTLGETVTDVEQMGDDGLLRALLVGPRFLKNVERTTNMAAVQKLEGRESSACLRNLPVRKENVREILVPIVVVGCCILTEHGLQCLVEALDKAVRLRVVGTRAKLLDVQSLIELFQESRHEVGSLISEDLGGDANT